MPKDPYQYFRIEAKEILDNLSKGAMDLEGGQISRDLVGSMLRLAHTLKGAARVVKQVEMADQAHLIEDLLEPYREGSEPLPRETASQLFSSLDECQARLKQLQSPAEKVAQPAALPTATRDVEDPLTSVRVEIAELDTFLSDLAEMSIHLGALNLETDSFTQVTEATERLMTRLAVLTRSLHAQGAPTESAGELSFLVQEILARLRHYQQSFQSRLSRAQRDFRSIREKAYELRLLPSRTIIPYLERSVRDAAESLQKQVALEVEGGETKLDSHVLLAVRDALLHVVRNAVAHGIENEKDRLAAGKPARGRIRLKISKQGQHISFVVEDDGQGLNLQAIRWQAEQQQRLTSSQASTLGMADATQLLLKGGISTAKQISSVSGRGVGMDVVRSTISRLKGTVNLNSEPRRGLSLEMVVPVSLESMLAVAVVVGDAWNYVPFHDVWRVVSVTEKDLIRSPQGTTFILEDQAIPFQPLDQILGTSHSRISSGRKWTAVVLQTASKLAAVGVDRLAGIRDVVVRPLPDLCGLVALVSGAVIDEGDNPLLLLNTTELVATLLANPETLSQNTTVQHLPILVVDDSLTTRMLEQSILEAAGYQVDLATSGEEALEKAAQKKYALFVVDVEMPGINGYQLLERFRADPKFNNIPAILVTSLSTPADRKRGELAGARAYIIKSEFHEGHLLRTIRDLVGESFS